MIIKDAKFLRQQCLPIKTQEEANEIINKLEEILKETKTGIGLAANQIGIQKQVAIARYEDLKMNIVNPVEILLSEDKFVYLHEGCLSYPGQFCKTLRSKEIKFKNGFEKEEQSFHIDNFHQTFIVAIQHEIDHFFGREFFDFILKPIKVEEKVNRNDPCPECLKNGEKIKYKKCKEHYKGKQND